MQGQIERSLSAELYRDMSRMFCGGTIDISAEQWCRIVYDMIVAFATAPDQHSVVESLKGLYFGRALAFMNKTWEWSTEQAEEEIELNFPMGTWLGFHDGATPMMAKLAVHDSQQDNYIFVNREGIKLRELSKRQLIKLIDDGLVDILQTQSSFRDTVARARYQSEE